jgi:hypothetical protein
MSVAEMLSETAVPTEALALWTLRAISVASRAPQVSLQLKEGWHCSVPREPSHLL